MPFLKKFSKTIEVAECAGRPTQASSLCQGLNAGVPQVSSQRTTSEFATVGCPSLDFRPATIKLVELIRSYGDRLTFAGNKFRDQLRHAQPTFGGTAFKPDRRILIDFYRTLGLCHGCSMPQDKQIIKKASCGRLLDKSSCFHRAPNPS